LLYLFRTSSSTFLERNFSLIRNEWACELSSQDQIGPCSWKCCPWAVGSRDGKPKNGKRAIPDWVDWGPLSRDGVSSVDCRTTKSKPRQQTPRSPAPDRSTQLLPHPPSLTSKHSLLGLFIFSPFLPNSFYQHNPIHIFPSCVRLYVC
jgi:hypothetical protein